MRKKGGNVDDACTCGTIAKTNRLDSNEFLPLWMHARDTSAVMERLYLHWLPQSIFNQLELEYGPECVRKLCVFIGLVHDIGKQTALFQHKIQQNLPDYHDCTLPLPASFLAPEKSPHARCGEAILLRYHCPPSVAAIVGAHHGKPQSELADLENDIALWSENYWGRNQKEWEECWQQMISAALAEAGFDSMEQLPTLAVSTQMLLTGLLIMGDWIASNTRYFPLISIGQPPSKSYDTARVEAAWKKLRLPEPWFSQYPMDAEAFMGYFGFSPRPVQRAVIDILNMAEDPGILILEAQMGVGKTEAALAAASLLANRGLCGGIFFGLPTQATANGLFPRVKLWAEYESQDQVHGIRLAHGGAALYDEYQALFQGTADMDLEEGLIAHSWFEGRKQALLSDFVIGTVDQLLMAALRQKHVMLRHLGLAGKTVIIDECHSYSPYMNQYLDRALTWLGEYGAPVIILSATLPAQRRKDMVYAYLTGKAKGGKVKKEEHAPWQESRAYPLITWTDGMRPLQQTVPAPETGNTVKIAYGTLEDIPALLEDALSQGGCAGIVVNTVKRAQTLAQQLRGIGLEVLDFHAQFVATDRTARENLLLQRVGKNSTPEQRNGLVVVGTQVIEQSLDVDFDLLITDLCPMDLLLQRIGRLHRHPRIRPPKLQEARCIVLEANCELIEPGAQAIYGQWLLLRTKQLLPEKIQLPGDIPDLVQEVYAPPAMDALTEQERAAYEEYTSGKSGKEEKARQFLLPKPKRSRFGDNTIDGLLERNMGASEEQAQATVRDGEPSVEVLVLRHGAGNTVFTLHDKKQERPFYTDHVPSEEECREIARQRLRLSAGFSKRWIVDRVIAELETAGREVLPEWQQSHWLKGELFLLLEPDGTGTLCGYHLYYSAEDGMCVEKVEKNERN
jgi:CRISPR-associated endonuclease/helicase Cas3